MSKLFVMNDGRELSPEETILDLLQRVGELEAKVKENQTVIDYTLDRVIDTEQILDEH